MPNFTVDVGGLDALSKNLDRTVDNIDSATKKLKDLGPDSIGPDMLDEACADFRDDWDEGLGEIKEALGDLKEGLDSARKAYADLENEIAEGLRRMRDAVGDAGVEV